MASTVGVLVILLETIKATKTDQTRDGATQYLHAFLSMFLAGKTWQLEGLHSCIRDRAVPPEITVENMSIPFAQAELICGIRIRLMVMDAGNADVVSLETVLVCLGKEALRRCKAKDKRCVHNLRILLTTLRDIVDSTRNALEWKEHTLRSLQRGKTKTGRNKMLANAIKIEIIDKAMTVPGMDAKRFAMAGKAWVEKESIFKSLPIACSADEGGEWGDVIDDFDFDEVEQPADGSSAQRPTKIQKAKDYDEYDWSMMSNYETTARLEFGPPHNIGVTHDGVNLNGEEVVPANFYSCVKQKSAWSRPQVTSARWGSTISRTEAPP
jgi:hypothetical protein